MEKEAIVLTGLTLINTTYLPYQACLQAFVGFMLPSENIQKMWK